MSTRIVASENVSLPLAPLLPVGSGVDNTGFSGGASVLLVAGKARSGEAGATPTAARISSTDWISLAGAGALDAAINRASLACRNSASRAFFFASSSEADDMLSTPTELQ